MWLSISGSALQALDLIWAGAYRPKSAREKIAD